MVLLGTHIDMRKYNVTQIVTFYKRAVQTKPPCEIFKNIKWGSAVQFNIAIIKSVSLASFRYTWLMEISKAIHLLGDILGSVISELESPELFATEERIRAAAKERRGGNVDAAKQLAAEVEALDVNSARVISAAFAAYFDLVNLAEENERVQHLRERELELHPQPLDESVGRAIETLKKDGVTAEQMQSLLNRLAIEL